MKIGILTFHWATNYGAVLQAYALQEFLISLGHEVDIINYKHHHYNYNLWTFIRYRHFLKPLTYLQMRLKEAAINRFRKERLSLTIRIDKWNEISYIAQKYDMIISGSDQVLNPSYLLNGDGIGVITPAYFLGFNYQGTRVAYAVSFGCTEYPEKASAIAKKFIGGFQKIGVRESSGLEIVEKLGGTKPLLVPDPTFLLDSEYYYKLVGDCTKSDSSQEIYAFFIRNIKERTKILKQDLNRYSILINNNDNKYSIESWIGKIFGSRMVITDSFHCMVMCLKLHRPFVIITELEGNAGMNDRFYSVLNRLGLSNRILHKSKITDVIQFLKEPIDWDKIENEITTMRNEGMAFFNGLLSN